MSKRTSVNSNSNGNSNGNGKQRGSLNDAARQRDQAALAKLDRSSKLAHTPGKKLKAAPRSTTAIRFRIPEAEVSPGNYTPGKKNPIHSILTALPILMLVAGLVFYYRGESDQISGAPIFAESVEVHGVFIGLSELKSGSEGQHFLWLTEATRKRGIRIQASEVALFNDMQRGLPMRIDMAPTVSGSKTLWAWRVRVDGELVFERDTTRDL